MSDYFLGEIRMFGFNFAPQQWAQCNGQTLGVAQNQALFALIGTKFGGNGSTTFNLPDLRSRVPMGFTASQGINGIGATAGTENVTLLQQQMPAHVHDIYAISQAGDNVEPAGGIMATTTPGTPTPQPMIYGQGPGNLALGVGTLTPVGGGIPHTNMQPYLTVNFCISLYGVFPSHG